MMGEWRRNDLNQKLEIRNSKLEKSSNEEIGKARKGILGILNKVAWASRPYHLIQRTLFRFSVFSFSSFFLISDFGF